MVSINISVKNNRVTYNMIHYGEYEKVRFIFDGLLLTSGTLSLLGNINNKDQNVYIDLKNIDIKKIKLEDERNDAFRFSFAIKNSEHYIVITIHKISIHHNIFIKIESKNAVLLEEFIHTHLPSRIEDEISASQSIAVTSSIVSSKADNSNINIYENVYVIDRNKLVNGISYYVDFNLELNEIEKTNNKINLHLTGFKDGHINFIKSSTTDDKLKIIFSLPDNSNRILNISKNRINTIFFKEKYISNIDEFINNHLAKNAVPANKPSFFPQEIYYLENILFKKNNDIDIFFNDNIKKKSIREQREIIIKKDSFITFIDSNITGLKLSYEDSDVKNDDLFFLKFGKRAILYNKKDNSIVVFFMKNIYSIMPIQDYPIYKKQSTDLDISENNYGMSYFSLETINKFININFVSGQLPPQENKMVLILGAPNQNELYTRHKNNFIFTDNENGCFIRGGDHGINLIIANKGNDKILAGQNSENILLGGFGKDQLYSRGKKDAIYGGADSDDLYDEDDGEHYLFGGADNDKYIFDKMRIGTGISYINDSFGNNILTFENFNENDITYSNVNREHTLTLTGNEGKKRIIKINDISAEKITVQIPRIPPESFMNFITAKQKINELDRQESDEIAKRTAAALKTAEAHRTAEAAREAIKREREIKLAKIFIGSEQEDSVTGSSTYTTFYGYGGADNITASAENDLIYGGRGNDDLSGEKGADDMHGESGNDTMYGGDDNDTMYGDDGEDKLQGGAGDDTMHGGKDNDILCDQEGTNHLFGGAGSDQFLLSEIVTNSGKSYIHEFSDEEQKTSDIDFLVIPEALLRLKSGKINPHGPIMTVIEHCNIVDIIIQSAPNAAGKREHSYTYTIAKLGQKYPIEQVRIVTNSDKYFENPQDSSLRSDWAPYLIDADIEIKDKSTISFNDFIAQFGSKEKSTDSDYITEIREGDSWTGTPEACMTVHGNALSTTFSSRGVRDIINGGEGDDTYLFNGEMHTGETVINDTAGENRIEFKDIMVIAKRDIPRPHDVCLESECLLIKTKNNYERKIFIEHNDNSNLIIYVKINGEDKHFSLSELIAAIVIISEIDNTPSFTDDQNLAQELYTAHFLVKNA